MIAIRQVAQGLRQARVTPSLPAVARRCFSEQPGDDLPPRATDLQAASGIPPVAPGRTVYIYSPSRVAGQHGLAQTIEGGEYGWKVQFSPDAKWINPLMGWTSTADPMENVHRGLSFHSKQAAIEFATKNGWTYEVEEPNPRNHKRPTRYIGYGDNYSVKRKGVPSGGLRSERS
ncbi:hypothetical protein QBZ16_000681 [Prototheca wickerhamii]|uniref:NADH dehydrogenase [ubiquinone] iron-sulfur protein 4, mitochondrial n=1 Tax=Prototheca wickerhamii TaxID=3111 RepID=A0AAD9IPN1_PROWI|nr:hypothetical protein QBZ16_000681 [Prototheca wickerhamii]